MIRIVYRWRVTAADRNDFEAAWKAATTRIRESTTGARGSFLLRSRSDPDVLVTVARWDSCEDWRAFWEGSARGEMRVMHDLAERLSAELYDELGDHTI